MYTVYKYTYMHVYIFKKNMLRLYIKYIYIWYNLYDYKYKRVNACKYFLNMLCVCIYNIHNKYTQYTHICKQKL